MPNRYRPNYKRDNDKNNWGFIILMFFIFGGGILSVLGQILGILMPVLIIGVISYFIFDSINSLYPN